MATFQSQINILAAGQHQLHKRIEDITDFSLFVKYDSLNMIISDNKDSNEILIQDLGSLAYDGILKVVDDSCVCLMANDGTYNCLTGTITNLNSLSITQACTLSINKNSLTITEYKGTKNATLEYKTPLKDNEIPNVSTNAYKFIGTAYQDIRTEYTNNAVEEGYGADTNEDPVQGGS